METSSPVSPIDSEESKKNETTRGSVSNSIQSQGSAKKKLLKKKSNGDVENYGCVENLLSVSSTKLTLSLLKNR